MHFQHSKKRSLPSSFLKFSSPIKWFEGFQEKPGYQLNDQRVHVTEDPGLLSWSLFGNPPGSADVRPLAKHIPRCYQ